MKLDDVAYRAPETFDEHLSPWFGNESERDFPDVKLLLDDDATVNVSKGDNYGSKHFWLLVAAALFGGVIGVALTTLVSFVLFGR